MSDKQCQFIKAWIGQCKNTMPCEEHASLECSSCGAPATSECAETGQFVCGEPLCDDCEHVTFPDGTNGGIGFNAQNLPGGIKRHCKKTDQVNAPWYARKTTR